MGLLGDYLGGAPLSQDPDKASAADAALWQIAAGLLSGRGPAGPTIGNAISQGMGAYQGGLDSAMKRRYVQSQMDENVGQNEMRRAQLAQLIKQQKMQEDFLRMLGAGGAPQAGGAGPSPLGGVPPGGGGAPSPLDPAMPGGPGPEPIGAAQAPAAPAGEPRFPGVPNQAAIAEMLFNKGQGLGGMIQKGSEPSWDYTASGIRFNKKGDGAGAPPTSVPSVDRYGRATQLMPDQDNPGGYRVTVPAGAKEAVGGYLQQEADIEAGNKLVTVTMPNGQTRQMTQKQALEMAGGGQQGQNPAAGGPQPGPQVSGGQPGKFGTPAALLDGLLRTESGGDPYAVNKQSGAMGPYQFMPATVAMLHKQGLRFNPFDPVEARDAADQYFQTLLKQNGGDQNKALAAYGGFKTKDPSGYIGSVTGQAPASAAAQRPASAAAPGMPGMEVQSPAAAAAAEARAKGGAEYFVDRQKTIATGGISAQSTLAKVDRAEQLFDGLAGGKLTPASSQVRSALMSLGVPGIDPERLGKEEGAQALTEGLAMAYRPANSGAVSDADLASFQKQVPTLAKTPEGRRQIMATMRGFAQRELKVAQMARDYMKLKGGLDVDFDDQLAAWQARNPIRF